MGNSAEEYLDALIVGAGFSGLHCLNKFRKLGFSVKIYERGEYLGGTWWENRYPGARVDSETPIYQITEKEVWESFEWKERFPGREELMRYFRHADSSLNLSKDICYKTSVTSAHFDEVKRLWKVGTDTGLSTWARHLVLCTGFAAKRYTPAFKGLEKFKGEIYHSNVYPEQEVDLKKRVAVIGTGASGVQIIQEIGPIVSHLTVYQRTPNLAIPMRQKFLNQDDNLEKKEIDQWQFPKKPEYEEIFAGLRKTFGALVIEMDFTTKKFHESSPSERRALYEYLWAYGGFSFWLATFKEIFYDQEANDEVYAFWAEKTRARLNDSKMKDLLAPLKAPHAWGTKRPCLETSYYEVYNQGNVDLINIRDSPILEITEQGIKTQKEGVVPVDVIILATGFDSVTGGILNIDIRNGDGLALKEKWGKGGSSSYLGMSAAEFPNMYWLYGPQAPTAFSNGPTTGGLQGDWIGELMVRMRAEGETRVEATGEGEAKWTENVKELWDQSLFPATDSWYQGANIPGKRREPLNWFGGIPKYVEVLREETKGGYKGFTIK